jgi:hypothetical protein
MRHNQLSIKKNVIDPTLVSRGLQKLRCGEARVSIKERQVDALDG